MLSYKEQKSRLFAFPAVLSILLIFLLEVFRPIKFPFADDWLLIPWINHSANPLSSDIFALVNGHQQAFTKIFFWLIGLRTPINLEIVSFTNFISFILGIFFLLKYIKFRMGKSYTKEGLFLLSAIALNLKPLQNYFMPICAGWMHAFLFIGVFFWSITPNGARYKSTFRTLCILLAPFTIGLGLVIPLLVIVEFFLNFLKKNIFPIKINYIDFVVAILSIITSYLIPTLMLSSRNISSTKAIQGPGLFLWNSLKSILILVGSVFAPSNRFSPLPEEIIGLCLFIFFAWCIRTSNSMEKILREPLVLTGFIFLCLIVLMRNGDQQASLLNLSSPRYVTGTLLLIIGVTLHLLTNFNLKSLQGKLIICLILIMEIGSIKTGINWNTTRFLQSRSIHECINLGNSVDLKAGNKCFNEAKTQSMPMTDENFSLQLGKFIQSSDFARKL